MPPGLAAACTAAARVRACARAAFLYLTGTLRPRRVRTVTATCAAGKEKKRPVCCTLNQLVHLCRDSFLSLGQMRSQFPPIEARPALSTSRAGLRRPEWLSWALTCGSRWRKLGSSPWARGTDRLDLEEAPLRQLPQMPDLQCAWLLLCYCAARRANHALRTIPPSFNEPYAAAHDAAVWGTLQACFGKPAEDVACPARDIAFLPAYLGGLGFAEAVRTASAAYWAAWADALPVLAARSPVFAAWTLRALSGVP